MFAVRCVRSGLTRRVRSGEYIMDTKLDMPNICIIFEQTCRGGALLLEGSMRDVVRNSQAHISWDHPKYVNIHFVI